jgi:hypothetical protein
MVVKSGETVNVIYSGIEQGYIIILFIKKQGGTKNEG